MKVDINNLKIDVIVEKLNVEMEQLTGGSSITPINDDPSFCMFYLLLLFP